MKLALRDSNIENMQFCTGVAEVAVVHLEEVNLPFWCSLYAVSFRQMET